MSFVHGTISAIHLIVVAVLGCTIALGEDVGSRDTDGPLPKHALLRIGSLRFLPRECTDRIEYSPDGRFLATLSIPEIGHLHPALQIWERSTGREVTPSGLKEIEVTGVSWSPDGNRFVTSHPTSELESCLNIWTVGNDKPQPLSGDKTTYATVCWAPRGGRIAAETWEHDFVMLDEKGVEQLRIPNGATKKVFHGARWIDFSPNGKQLAIVRKSGVQIFAVTNGAVIAEIPIADEELWAIRFLPDGKSVAVAADRGVQVYAIDEPNVLVRTYGDRPTLDFSVSRDQKWLATSGFFSHSQEAVWDFKTGERVHSYVDRMCGGVAFAPDNSELALATRRISFLKLGNWAQIRTGDDHSAIVTTGLVQNDRLWMGGLGPDIREWDLSTGKSLRSLARKSGLATCLAAIDDRRIAVAGWDAEIDIFDTETKIAKTLPGHPSGTTGLGSSSQPRRLISAGVDGFVRSWNVETNSIEYEVAIPTKFGLVDLEFSPDGKLVVGGNPNTQQVHLFRASDGSTVLTRNSSVVFSRASFTSDSSRLIAPAYAEKEVRDTDAMFLHFWDVTSGKDTFKLEIGATPIHQIAVTPTAQLIAIATSQRDDHSIQIWSLISRRRVAVLHEYENPRRLCFTFDGKRLVSIKQDTTAFVWDIPAAIKDYADNTNR